MQKPTFTHAAIPLKLETGSCNIQTKTYAITKQKLANMAPITQYFQASPISPSAHCWLVVSVLFQSAVEGSVSGDDGARH